MKNNNKATAAAAVLLILIASSIMHSAAARVFKVGDDFGWQQPSNNNSQIYPQWATSNRFQVGDSLLFEYKNDSVAQVDKWGYYHCNITSTSMAVFDNGRSTLKLDQPGPFYFISGNFNHCQNGQLLLLEVMSTHHTYHPTMAPYPSAFPPSYTNPSEGSSSSSPSSDADQPNSAAIVSVVSSSVAVVLIATFVALAWFAP